MDMHRSSVMAQVDQQRCTRCTRGAHGRFAWPRMLSPTKPPTARPKGGRRIVAAADMLHFRSWSLDGLLGLSPIEHAMQSLGIALASEKFGGRFFANGGRPNGVLSTNSMLTDKQQADMKSTWQGQVGGENQG